MIEKEKTSQNDVKMSDEEKQRKMQEAMSEADDDNLFKTDKQKDASMNDVHESGRDNAGEVSIEAKRVKHLENQLRLLAADNANLKHVQQMDMRNAIAKERKRSAELAMSVCDAFLLAFKNINEHSLEGNDAAQDLFKGMKMLFGCMKDALGKRGIEVHDPKGKQFNPAMHEIITTVPNPSKQDGYIVDVASPCYTVNGNVVRHAKVIVVKNG